MTKTMLITGATGNVSAAVIAQLKDSAHRVWAPVRSPEKADELRRQSIELQVGDLEKPWTLGPASLSLHQVAAALGEAVGKDFARAIR